MYIVLIIYIIVGLMVLVGINVIYVLWYFMEVFFLIMVIEVEIFRFGFFLNKL